MQKNKPTYKTLSSLCVICLIASAITACNMPVAGEEPPPEESFPVEPLPGEPPPDEPPPDEFQPEEPPPDEPMPEEPPLEEPMPEEPPPGEPSLPEPEPPQPQPQPQPGGGGGNWTTDVAVTDIFPGKQPTGQFQVRITNNGPGTLNNVNVEVICGFFTVDKNNGAAGPSNQSNLNLKLGMRPGETQVFPTNLGLDMNTFEYTVGCDIYPGFDDPDPSNNSYTETFK
jgi:outer membrane biosynthesis protein TonB